MCTAKCSRCIAVTLFPLAAISIICSIVLFFPGGDIKYAKEGHITEEVKYMGGLIGGGIMVLISALYIQCTGEEGCCGNRCGMFFSIIFAGVAVFGALLSMALAVLALRNGPLCKYEGQWTTPFNNSDLDYLNNPELWEKCTEPERIVQFNTGLFITLIATNSLQAFLCNIQMINGFFGCLCGTCIKK
ncbi:transmembrane 4 L6 family member 5-like [Thunnus albacares]|uniref:transmembrane 4 L6 family member 5-like n=1 Tax=Thunnus albacares TaxID=8236 RepID=UPI001CF6B1EB|nr:transmembrane 4 L6 family member 5-like [Thunnus albacares]